MTDKVIAIMSGGLDSTTLVYKLVADGFDVDCISFNYGQKHVTELLYASLTCDKLGLKHNIVDMGFMGTLFSESGSSLISSTEVPEGHYAEDNMKSTVVPNRNMIMISIAGGLAVSRDAVAVATGVHAGDHFVYPDCRSEFVSWAEAALYSGNEGFGNLQSHAILAPFMYASKEDIALRALQLGVPLENTWSCYKGGTHHCGKCGTCVERLEAIHGARERYMGTSIDGTAPEDKTQYEDTNFWKTAVKA